MFCWKSLENVTTEIPQNRSESSTRSPESNFFVAVTLDWYSFSDSQNKQYADKKKTKFLYQLFCKDKVWTEEISLFKIINVSKVKSSKL